MPVKKPKSKLKKAAKKAHARRAAKLLPPARPPAPVKPHVYPQDENKKLHATSAYIAGDARGLEVLMERKRWSNI
jgi:hypothetical protein